MERRRNVERHKSGVRGEPGSTAARAVFQAHRQHTAPARQGQHRGQTDLMPQRKGPPAPPGAVLVWGVGSAGQHTVISMVKSL